MHAGKNITGDGFGFRQNIVRGNSQGETLFTGGITAEDSTIVIKDKAKALFSNYVYLLNTKATIENGADVTTQSGMFSTSDISISGNLSMTGNPDKDNKFEPSIYLNDASYLLTDDSARLVAKIKHLWWEIYTPLKVHPSCLVMMKATSRSCLTEPQKGLHLVF